MELKILGQSVVKAENDIYENNKQRLNEDALFIGNTRAAISDGAGGTGILANRWAKTLVSHIPEQPFTSAGELNSWIDGFLEEFYVESKNILQNDSWQLNKFDNEGSSATLAIIWHLSDNNFEYVSYGDSALFIYNQKNETLRIQKNLASVNSFTTSPPLLNWKSEQIDVSFFYREKFSLEKNEIAILATDGLAMYLHGAYLALTDKIEEPIREEKMKRIIAYFRKNKKISFKNTMQSIYSSLDSEESFSELTRNWYKNKSLPNDDYTLIWINPLL